MKLLITLEPHGIFGSSFAYSFFFFFFFFYVTGRQIGNEGLPSIILAGYGLLVKMLIILELHIYFDQILHTGTLIYILTLSETLVCQRVTKVTSNDVTSSPA